MCVVEKYLILCSASIFWVPDFVYAPAKEDKDREFAMFRFAVVLSLVSAMVDALQ